MPIHDWPIDDRPREKLLRKGEQVLSDAELIAIFLQTGTRGKTALDIARDLLAHYGNVKSLLRTPPATLLATSGVGQAKYALLKAAIELGRRYLYADLPVGIALNNSHKSLQFLTDSLREHVNEVFACVFLDNHYRLLSYEELFKGTIHTTHIYPREIIKRGLAHNAAKIILAHNHPSGRALPSEADKEATRLIKNALAMVDIDIVDHLIIGNPGHFSFAEAGIL